MFRKITSFVSLLFLMTSFVSVSSFAQPDVGQVSQQVSNDVNSTVNGTSVSDSNSGSGFFAGVKEFFSFDSDKKSSSEFLEEAMKGLSKSDRTKIEKQIKRNTKGRGATYSISSINFKGNESFSDEALIAAINSKSGGDYKSQKYSKEGLDMISMFVNSYYRDNGYESVSVKISRRMSGKEFVVTLAIEEGKYDQIMVNVAGSTNVAEKKEAEQEIRKYFDHVKSGDVANKNDLNRAIIALKNIPGYDITVSTMPSKGNGKTNIVVFAKKTKSYNGSISVNNHGSRYLGTFQAMANVNKNNTFRFGDNISLVTLKSQGDLWFGSLGYSTPISTSGLVAGVKYSRAQYDLGKEYASSDIHGYAETANANFSYPLAKSQVSALNLTTSYDHKWFTNKSNSSRTKKHSDVLPIGLNFFEKDSVLGGGVTYGNASWTFGVLHLDGSLKVSDDSGARTDGEFSKFNFDITRVQKTNVKRTSVFARVSGQVATDNLDSSESFGAGGPNAVRAYPSGEGFGDEGYLGQFEIRYRLDNNFTPFVLYDLATVRTNHNAYESSRNDRSLAGYGLGLKYNRGQWNASSTIAWRKTGGEPTSDTKDKTPMIWVTGSYSF